MTLTMALCCPSMGQHEAAWTSWQSTASQPLDVTVLDQTQGDEAGFLTKCQGFHAMTGADILGYLHSDLFIHEPKWDERVMAAFAMDDRCAVVGFVGATRLGHPDIYKIPYAYTQLARADVFSNLTDWSSHGAREEGLRPVAVVDSCAVFVRRHLLDLTRGWPVGRYPDSSHCSDLWLCAMAYRYGYRVHVVGVEATHRSGGKGEAGAKWLEVRGGDTALHREAHRVFYDDFKAELPLVIR